MLDSLSFMQGSLDSLVQLLCKNINPSQNKTLESILPITVQTVTESRFDNKVIPFLTQKLVYPYSLPKKLDDFENIDYFPDKKDFYDELTETHISDAAYNSAKHVYEISGCKNLRDLHDLYLLTDTAMLADVWKDFNKHIYEAFGIYATNFISGPALSFRIGLKLSETDIQLLSKFSMYEIFTNAIRGGYCCVNKRYIHCNNVDMGKDFDPTKKSSTAIMIDFNSLYAECLTENMPYADFEYSDNSTISQFEKDPLSFLKIDIDGPKGYWVTCDFYIPENLARLTDDMPLAIINTVKILPSPYTLSIGGKFASQEKLIAAHVPLERYSLHLKLLCFYIRLGVVITKVHSIIEFSQKPLFKKYIEYCSSARKKAEKENNPVKKRLYKLLPNAFYGKSLQNELKFDTTNVLTVNGERYRKLCSSHRFKSRKWIVKDKIALVTMRKPVIQLKSPIFIGATVLQLAKLKNLSFDLQVAKPSSYNFTGTYPIRLADTDIINNSRKYIDHISIIYCDTDSILYYIFYTDLARNMTHDELFKNTFLNKYLDRSNFKILSTQSYCSPMDLGFLKSEVQDNIIIEVIALSPKCYSIQSKERANDNLLVKFAVKGVPVRPSDQEIYAPSIL